MNEEHRLQSIFWSDILQKIDENKITDTARVSVIWNSFGICVDLNYSYSDTDGYGESALCFCETYADGTPDEKAWSEAQQIGRFLKEKYYILMDSSKDDVPLNTKVNHALSPCCIYKCQANIQEEDLTKAYSSLRQQISAGANTSDCKLLSLNCVEEGPADGACDLDAENFFTFEFYLEFPAGSKHDINQVLSHIDGGELISAFSESDHSKSLNTTLHQPPLSNDTARPKIDFSKVVFHDYDDTGMPLQFFFGYNLETEALQNFVSSLGYRGDLCESVELCIDICSPLTCSLEAVLTFFDHDQRWADISVDVVPSLSEFIHIVMANDSERGKEALNLYKSIMQEYMEVVDKFVIDDQSAVYTVSLEPGFMVDVKVFEQNSLAYIMQNSDGSTVYGENGCEQTYPELGYCEDVVIQFVKDFHSKVQSESKSTSHNVIKETDHSMKAVNIEWDIDVEDKESVSLPTEIVIPKGMKDEDEISDYLSDVTGFCHKGFILVETEKSSLDDKIQSASARAAESHPSDRATAKKSVFEH